MDAVFAEMIGGDVGDDGGIGRASRQAAAQDAAARGFQDRGLRVALRSAVRAPVGPEKSPDSSACPSTNTPSVQLCAVCQPCARAIAASRRTVVVLPLEPVTSAVGIACSAAQSTAVGSGQRIDRPRRAAVACADRHGIVVGQERTAPRAGRFASRARNAGFSFGARRSRAGCAARSPRPRSAAWPGAWQRDEPPLAPGARSATRPPRPFVDFGRRIQLVGRRSERQRGPRAMLRGPRPRRPASRAPCVRRRCARASAPALVAAAWQAGAFPAPRRCRRNRGCSRSAGANPRTVPDARRSVALSRSNSRPRSSRTTPSIAANIDSSWRVSSAGNSTRAATLGASPSGWNLMICFHVRVSASANTSTRSPGRPCAGPHRSRAARRE